MLNYYLLQTQRLLQNPSAPVTLYSTADLTSYVNVARAQIAGEGRCIRRIGTLTTTIGTRMYPFSSIVFTDTAVQGAINVRALLYNVGTGMKWINGKSWEWFQYFRLNNPVPTSAAPTEWSQHAQGSAGVGTITNIGSGTMSSGSLWLDPLPDLAYTINCDATCYPIALVADTDKEAIPFMWTDCVAYFSAYLALMGSQTSSRIQQAQQLFALYEQFMQRARDFANPDPNNYAFEQAPDPFKGNRLGAGQAPQQGAGNAA